MSSSTGCSKRRLMKMVRRGVPKGNQDGRKHSFYSQALDEAKKFQLEQAQGIEGVDEEIAILRVKLRELVEKQPDRLDLYLAVATTIARLVKTRYSITKEQKKSLKEAIARVLTEIAIPLGVKSLIR